MAVLCTLTNTSDDKLFLRLLWIVNQVIPENTPLAIYNQTVKKKIFFVLSLEWQDASVGAQLFISSLTIGIATNFVVFSVQILKIYIY